MNRQIVLRAGGLVLLGFAAVAGLAVYFSTQQTPLCLATGVPKWRAPTDPKLHRFELVVPDRALCFFDMDSGHALVGYVDLKPIEGVTAIAPRSNGLLALRYGTDRGALVDLSTGRIRLGVQPPPAPTDRLSISDVSADVEYATGPGELGFRILDPTGRLIRAVTFPGFTWNRAFGPDPPDHGLSLAPDKRELWVLDAPNSYVHVFDVSAVPGRPPRQIADIHLTKPLAGDENPCATHRCGRIGSLQPSADGRFVYVGDAGDVIDTSKREEIANLEALHQSRLMLEVDWADRRPEFPSGAR